MNTLTLVGTLALVAHVWTSPAPATPLLTVALFALSASCLFGALRGKKR
jgi:hypothetical protein